MKRLNHSTKFRIVSIFFKKARSTAFYFIFISNARRNFVSDLFLIRACLPYDNKSIFPFHSFQSSSFVISRECLKFTDSRNAGIKIALSTLYTLRIGALVVYRFFSCCFFFFTCITIKVVRTVQPFTQSVKVEKYLSTMVRCKM